MRIICSGGGTGGHIYPAIAVADEIKKRRQEAEILFVGATGKMEMDIVPKAGYDIKGLPIRGFQRNFKLTNLSFPVRLLLSLAKARKIVKNFEPVATIGFGGYASGAVLYASTQQRVPILLQEQNSYPGITNKIMARKAEKICVAYPDMQRFFPADKLVLTGNPIRHDLTESMDRKEAKHLLGLDTQKPLVFLSGGSLGAGTLNRVMKNAFPTVRDMKHVNWIWQCGRLYYSDYESCETSLLSHVRMLSYIERMDLMLSAADVVICRAGAISLSEICAMGRASVIVPSPNVAEDHQTKNAQALVDRKAALVVKDAEAEELLLTTVQQLIDNQKQRLEIESNALSLARPQATRHIADSILQIIDTHA